MADIQFKLPSFKSGVPVPGTIKQGKGGSVLAMTLDQWPMTKEAYGDRFQTSVCFVILEVDRAGFARVPQEFKKNKYVVPDSAQHLTEVCDKVDEATGKSYKVLKCFSYVTIEGCPKDKGPIKHDVSHYLAPGMVIRHTFFSDKARGGDNYDKRLVPLDNDDFLPAFSCVNLEWCTKGWTPWEDGQMNPVNNKIMKACPPSCGYGGAIVQATLIPGVTAYSFTRHFADHMAKTVSECQKMQRAFLTDNRPIEQMIAQQHPCCWQEEVSTEAHITYDPDRNLVKIYNWGAGATAPVDIELQCAMRHTNSSTVDECCKILELHLLTGSLSLVLGYSDYRVKVTDSSSASPLSPYFGAPILRPEKMFAKALENPQLPLDDTKEFAVMQPGWRLPDEDDKMIESYVKISVAVLPAPEGVLPKIGCPDLCLTSCDKDCVRKGHNVAVIRGDMPCWVGRWAAFPSLHTRTSTND